jgi:outer membrane protein, adhesin transport system
MLRFKSSACALAIGMLFSGVTSAQTLKDTVTHALASSPDILIDANHRLSLEEALKAAKGGYFPKIDLAVGHGSEWSNNSTTRAVAGGGYDLTRREAAITLRQMLFDGSGVAAEVERSQATLESATGKVASTTNKVALDAVEAYLEVVRNRELLDLTKANLLTHERIQDQIRLRSDSGHGRRSDLEQASARVALAKANLTSVQANLADAEINFKRIVGMAPGNLGEIDQVEGALPATLDEALEIALREHPASRAAQADINAARAQHRASNAAMFPKVDLEIGASKNNNIDGTTGANDDRYAMLRLRYSLFNGGSDLAKTKQMSHLIQEADAVRDRTLLQIEQSTRLSWNALTAANARLPSLKEHADFSALTRDAYVTQFGVGQRTLLDMLDSENEAYTASTNYLSGRLLTVFAHYRVLADMGKLDKLFEPQQ